MLACVCTGCERRRHLTRKPTWARTTSPTPSCHTPVRQPCSCTRTHMVPVVVHQLHVHVLGCIQTPVDISAVSTITAVPCVYTCTCTCTCVWCVCAESFQDAGVIEAAYELNNPLTVLDLEVPHSLADVTSYFSVDTAQVVLDTVKLVGACDAA